MGSLKTVMDWSQYRDVNPVSTILLVNDLATASSGPVMVSVLEPFLALGRN